MKHSRDFQDAEKENVRTELLRQAVSIIVGGSTTAQNIKTLVLVDGCLNQARDIEILESLGVHRNNVWAVSRKWNDIGRMNHAGVNIVEGELSSFLQRK